jgi:D-glutamate cyclase
MSDNGATNYYENLDRVVTVEMRPPSLPQGFVPRLYAAARGSGPPIVQRIAEELAALEPGKIAIFTGVMVPPYLKIGEMDGPPGGAVLAAALGELGHDVQLVVESAQVGAARALCDVAGADGALVTSLAADGNGDATSYASGLDAAIAIEKLSANAQGIRHSVLGTRLDSMDERTDRVFQELSRLGRLTIGIGDGGNEIGFGALGGEVRRILGDRADCTCGCDGGIVAATATRFLLPCAISNSGAYAVTAGLALALERPDLCPDAALVGALLETGLAAGLLDGGTLDPGFLGDDGVPGAAITAVVELLSTIVAQRARVLDKRPF